MPHFDERRGRPSKICPEAREKILAGIKSNLPYKFCAWDARIHESTLYRWLEQAEADVRDNLVSEYTLLREAIKEAEAQKVRSHLEFIEGCPERWQARMTILERRWRDDFSANPTSDQKDKTINTLLEMFQSEQKNNK